MIGERFGRLVVIAREENSPARKRRWRCRCDCGGEKVIVSGSLLSRRQVSCGCFRGEVLRSSGLKHGNARRGAKTGTWRSWVDMRKRCLNPKNWAWKYYGGRGIGVCPRWDSFENFLADMGERPEGLTLDRVDNERGYSPDNCRWATRAQQSQNRRKPFARH